MVKQVVGYRFGSATEVLSCYAGTYGMSDYNAFVISGRPKQGQTLDEVKDLFLAELIS